MDHSRTKGGVVMAKHTIVGFGYQGKRPEELLRLTEELDAVVVDVRIKPFSRVRGWNSRELMALLGVRYQWCRDLGSENYRAAADAPVKLVDWQAGQSYLLGLLERTNVILLCYEADESQCHRRLILDLFDGEQGEGR